MSTSCTPAPENKKEYITDIGRILVKEYGKKEYYQPEEVKDAHNKSKWYDGLDFSCWGMSTFSSHADFDQYHQRTGELCDYVDMKAEMLHGLSLSTGSDIFDSADFDIDASWLDFGDVFGSIVEGICGLISGICDVD
ncbi:hypothetical protein [Fibrisoma limi]|uniref:hypothetical protein n=1 Tax=Fibrisoma limi TaxID=663275 RepID=UPI000586C72B|nr:hypothetical protein [Fibrisoma limi]